MGLKPRPEENATNTLLRMIKQSGSSLSGWQTTNTQKLLSLWIKEKKKWLVL
jgi:hypothetical protein